MMEGRQCAICGAPFIGAVNVHVCSDPCRSEYRRRYYRRRYWRNPEFYREKALAGYHRNPQRKREPDPLVRKVMKEWRTGRLKARAMITAGSFPP